MSGRKELSIETRALIVSHHSTRRSNREIAKLLKLKRRTMDYNDKKYEDTGSLSKKKKKKKKRSVRPKITTSAEDRAITIISKRNRRKTAPELTAEINASRPEPVSLTTVKRRLRKAGLHARIAMRKPLLREQNKAKRLAWAKSHKNWTLEDWKKVLRTDESKFEIFG
ncbi:Transposable element Tc1 transposase [Anthophora plagiata]